MLYSYLEQITKAYPDFEVHTCESDDSGQYNDILLINQAYVFRFPRFQTWVAALACEIKLLTWLQEQLPLSIPNPCFYKIDDPVPGKAFMGYFMIPGETLTRQKLHALQGQAAWKGMAAQSGEFLRVLHGLDVTDLGVELPAKDDRTYWMTMYADIRELLFDAMRPDARQAVCRHFESYLDIAQSHPFTPCLRHGDFGPSNILYDPDAMVAQGVIDFSFAAMGDPAVDLASLSCYGDDFLQEALRYYPVNDGALRRAQFYRGTFALQEALAGVRYHDRQAYEVGIATYI